MGRDQKSLWNTRWRKWVLLTGDRAVVAMILLIGVLTLLIVLLATDVVGVRDSAPITRTFSALIGGNLTLLTIIISINQLILAREFGTPDEFEDRIGEIMKYRKEAEELAESPASPVNTDEFLDYLSQTLLEHATTLRDETTEAKDEHLREELDTYANLLITHSKQTISVLETAKYGTFETVLALFRVEYTKYLHMGRRIRARYDEDFSPAEIKTLDEIIRLLELVGVARQYFKTLYLQRELADVSRLLFYVGIPAVLASLLANWIYGNDAVLTAPALDVTVLLSTIVAVSPLVVLFSYVVRAATIAKQTASVMPFTVQAKAEYDSD